MVNNATLNYLYIRGKPFGVGPFCILVSPLSLPMKCVWRHLACLSNHDLMPDIAAFFPPSYPRPHLTTSPPLPPFPIFSSFFWLIYNYVIHGLINIIFWASDAFHSFTTQLRNNIVCGTTNHNSEGLKGELTDFFICPSDDIIWTENKNLLIASFQRYWRSKSVQTISYLRGYQIGR